MSYLNPPPPRSLRDDYRPPRDVLRRLWWDGFLCCAGIGLMAALAYLIIWFLVHLHHA